MSDTQLAAQLAEFARSYRGEGVAVRDAIVSFDASLDGEPVTRVALMLNDPPGDTWDVDRISELGTALGRKATRLGLPWVTLTLVGESEPEAQDVFAR